jgi:hypothetical protein
MGGPPSTWPAGSTHRGGAAKRGRGRKSRRRRWRRDPARSLMPWAAAPRHAPPDCRCVPPSAPAGPRDVATGGAESADRRAERNPWRACPFLDPAPEGQRVHLRACRPVCPVKLLRPCRGGFRTRRRSTGCATLGPWPLRGGAASLHPWLHPSAPSGRRVRGRRSTRGVEGQPCAPTGRRRTRGINPTRTSRRTRRRERGVSAATPT